MLKTHTWEYAVPFSDTLHASQEKQPQHLCSQRKDITGMQNLKWKEVDGIILGDEEGTLLTYKLWPKYFHPWES